jgi:hypothetical protein
LVTELGQYHAAVHWALTPLPHATAPQNATPPSTLSNLSIAKKAVHNLLDYLDLEILQYLDINRSKLVEIYISKYEIDKIPKLSNDDHKTVGFVTKALASYLK